MSSAPQFSDEYLAEDRGPTLIGISSGFGAATTVIVILRFYTKRFLSSRKFMADDGFLVAAYVVNLLMCILGIAMTERGGVGRHFVTITDRETILLWGQYIFAFELLYFTSTALPKLSVICLYLQLFSWKGYMRALAWALFAITIATSAALIICTFVQCTPIAYFWDRTIPGGRCFNVEHFYHAQALPGIIIDLAIMALPVGTIWALKLPTIKKLALVGLFVVASFGIVAAMFRADKFFHTQAFSDPTFAAVSLVGWSIIETSVYIITCCLPHLRPLASHYTPPWLKRVLKVSVARTFTRASRTRDGLSYGQSTNKRVSCTPASGIQKATTITHTFHTRGFKDDDDSIELIAESPKQDAGWSAIAHPSADARLPPRPESDPTWQNRQSQSLGTTTNITSGYR